MTLWMQRFAKTGGGGAVAWAYEGKASPVPSLASAPTYGWRHAASIGHCKEYPSMLHPCFLRALRLLGAHHHIHSLVPATYQGGIGAQGDVRFPLQQGIKEGCLRSPPMFVLVHQAFHATLAHQFANNTTLVDVDDAAIITSK